MYQYIHTSSSFLRNIFWFWQSIIFVLLLKYKKYATQPNFNKFTNHIINYYKNTKSSVTVYGLSIRENKQRQRRIHLNALNNLKYIIMILWSIQSSVLSQRVRFPLLAYIFYILGTSINKSIAPFLLLKKYILLYLNSEIQLV